ncbi:hypothetical protein A3D80_01135 [Candidatus Roizmanbacteria bacterium RIFCSPHIGHO2_02_FULL_40_13b]|uniref:YtxH domain-containing protein n=1 Tax=Candidatus Roizmanbacteria bacterium RIFCSPHIGHO2_01_FULL_39_24 TaxID=1802032 RepID=A0A1F7GLI7_9BACT|nr:MAG: hypothetical protein A2799_01275 [Candidatus Roizmanbacteria bacterium RIFCSPHIGHO2_01_FULL_39_24]OGK26300.1 MAG: hypothetical protein A3D80_01135 [Candidatus Roizmanbacteria bacterium RIFCSPHIGHO2_02_FULL_40_13b]OGK49363.1 MAG: hypothetical protein A3A56_03765 [Candidatus Roizmanbacteria bacterium RIFCSPLOWO2_01_FULL_40_32]
MTKNSPHHQSFWSGLSLGVIVGGSALALFGTKKGREVVHKLLDISENFEDVASDFIGNVEDELKEQVGPAIQTRGVTAIESLMDKIQSVLPEKVK